MIYTHSIKPMKTISSIAEQNPGQERVNTNLRLADARAGSRTVHAAFILQMLAPLRHSSRASANPQSPRAGNLRPAKLSGDWRRRYISAPAIVSAAVAMLSVATVGFGAPSSKVTPEQLDFFEQKIRPVLVQQCYDCHSEEKGKSKGELTLDSRDGIRAGGDRGPAVVPGKPDESILLNAIRQVGQLRMPPDSRGGMLPDEVINDFEKWIKDGAPDPRDATKIVDARPAKPAKIYDWKKEREYWAFQKPKAAAPPKVGNKSWPKTDVDHFVLAKLEAKGLKPVADADKRTLVRRVYYDITGLPPTPQQVQNFAKDNSPEAYEKLVDSLLASPRFGEQWGRYWLDVARYGESTGMDRNLNFPYAWRYRDYVIDAFNNDKPYNKFVTEQLAGDQLPYGSQKERDENLTATGFLAIGPKGLNETRLKYSKWQVVNDQIDATSRGFLGLTVSCAQCHDHKFDPIPTRDYHALAGIFASTDTLYGTVGGRGNRRPTSLLSLNGEPELAVLYTGEPTPNMFVNTNRNFSAAPRARRGGTNNVARRGFGRNISTNVLERIPAHKSYAMGVRDLGEPQDVPVFYRGELSKPTDAIVPRGFPRIVALPEVPSIPTNASGRLQLAQWITDPDNPLTARVAVNRVWQHLFGEGIVATTDNFGRLGAQPTNPELLDYLAVNFVQEQHWSVKQLVRSLVLTRAYQLSSDVYPKAEELDPADTLVWRARPRRLKAEQLRDSILASSSELDLEPPHFGVTAEFGDGYYGVNIWESDLPQHYYKRSVYLPLPRDMVPDSLALFDLPNPNLVGALREETTSPSQELFLMNNAFVQDESLHLARQLLNNRKLSENERIKRAYLAVFQRLPSSQEVKQAAKFINSEIDLLASAEPPAVDDRLSHPELEIQPKPNSDAPLNTNAISVTEPLSTPKPSNGLVLAAVHSVTTNSEPATVMAATAGTGDAGGNFGGRGQGGFRPRTFKGPGSASDVIVGKLAPGNCAAKSLSSGFAREASDARGRRSGSVHAGAVWKRRVPLSPVSQ